MKTCSQDTILPHGTRRALCAAHSSVCLCLPPSAPAAPSPVCPHLLSCSQKCQPAPSAWNALPQPCVWLVPAHLSLPLNGLS